MARMRVCIAQTHKAWSASTFHSFSLMTSTQTADQSGLRTKHHQIAEDNHQIQASRPERPYAQEGFTKEWRQHQEKSASIGGHVAYTTCTLQKICVTSTLSNKLARAKKLCNFLSLQAWKILHQSAQPVSDNRIEVSIWYVQGVGTSLWILTPQAQAHKHVTSTGTKSHQLVQSHSP